MTTADPRYRPLPLRTINRLSPALLERAGLALDPDALIARARRITALEDLGPDDFEAPFRTLTTAYAEEARLNAVGVLAVRSYLLRLLANRLRLERDRAHYPEVAAQEIERPLVILGLPRTGSTLLHELLAQDPGLRTPLTWEVMLPSPPPHAASFARDARIRRTRRLLAWVDRIAPEFKRIHPVGAGLPQECIAITAQAFRSIQFHTTQYVPSYQDWLEQADQRPAYRYHRRMLQQFQAFGPRGQWLLKAPAHIFAPEALFEAYPDARIVQTHRDPLRVVGSIASHCASLRQAFSEHVKPAYIGAEWSRRWAVGLARTLRFREERPELTERFLDVEYAALFCDPIHTVERIYAHIGRVLEPSVRERMQAWLARHPQGRFGRHRYTLATFGLDPERERERFASYLRAYAIPEEPLEQAPY